MRQKYQILLALLLACLVSVVAWLMLAHLREPIYGGKRIGEWFHDLSIPNKTAFQKPERRRQSRDARLAFQGFDSNAVPFLAKQLRTPDGLQEALILRARQLPVVGGMFEDLLLPRQKRGYALSALTLMGTNANLAIPVLVETLQRETQTNLSEGIIVALGRASGYDVFVADSEARMLQRIDEVLGNKGPGITAGEVYDPRDFDREQVLTYVRSRYPECFSNSQRSIEAPN